MKILRVSIFVNPYTELEEEEEREKNKPIKTAEEIAEEVRPSEQKSPVKAEISILKSRSDGEAYGLFPG